MNDPGQRHWTETKERGNYWAMRILVAVYRVGGRLLLKPLVTLVVLYFFITRPSVRRHSAAYLRRVLGRPPRWRDLWRHQLSFGLALVDRLGAWMGRIRRTDVAFDGHQTMLDLQARSTGAVLLGAHLGNLEMCRAVVTNDGSMKLNVILHNRNTENFNRLIQNVSGQSGIRLIQVDDITPVTAMQLRAKLDQGEFLILLADRLPPGNTGRFIRHPVLGDDVRLPMGPFWLSLMLGAPVYFMAGFATNRGHRAVLEPLYDGGKVARRDRDRVSRELVSSYVHYLERYCRRYPFQWFNFYDYWEDDLPLAPASTDRFSTNPLHQKRSSDE